MNKTKKLLILCLAIILCICCVVPSFSWYNHSSNIDDVNAIEYNRSSLPVSGNLNGLKMTTYQGTLASNGEVSYDETKSVETITAGKSSDGEYNTTCYKSVIKNDSAKDVYVGLYLETAEFGSGDDEICFGTSDPIWRRITAASMNTKITPKKTSTGTMRVYFQKTYQTTVWSETEFYIVAYSNDYNHKLYPMTHISGSIYYYADIPSTSTYFFLTCEESLEPSRDFRRTNAITAKDDGLTPINPILIWLIEGDMVDNKYMHANISKDYSDRVNIVNFVENLYLSTSDLNDANTGSVALKSGDDYIGNSIKYTSNNEDVATVDAEGKVTAKGAGTAVITTTVSGLAYPAGNTSVVQTTVNVQDPSKTLPLVQNILVSANGESTVCWYIDNKSTTKDLNDIKLMLTL